MDKKRPWLYPITDRVHQPTIEEVTSARKRAGLGQAAAAVLISSASKVPHRVWQHFESMGNDHRDISLAGWELFLLLTDQHPTLALVERQQQQPGQPKSA